MRCDHKLEITQTVSALCHFLFCWSTCLTIPKKRLHLPFPPAWPTCEDFCSLSVDAGGTPLAALWPGGWCPAGMEGLMEAPYPDTGVSEMSKCFWLSTVDKGRADWTNTLFQGVFTSTFILISTLRLVSFHPFIVEEAEEWRWWLIYNKWHYSQRDRLTVKPVPILWDLPAWVWALRRKSAGKAPSLLGQLSNVVRPMGMREDTSQTSGAQQNPDVGWGSMLPQQQGWAREDGACLGVRSAER